jgi:L-rhamnose mutarotase
MYALISDTLIDVPPCHERYKQMLSDLVFGNNTLLISAHQIQKYTLFLDQA